MSDHESDFPHQPFPDTAEGLVAADEAERRHGELAQEHWGSLYGLILNQGVEIDRQGVQVVGMAATQLARIDVDFPPERRPAVVRDLLVELAAVEAGQPLAPHVVRALMDYRDMEPFTPDELQRVAERKAENAVVATQMEDIFGKIRELVSAADIFKLSMEEELFLQTLASEYHGLLYATPAGDRELLRTNLRDKYRSFNRQGDISSQVYGIAVRLLS